MDRSGRLAKRKGRLVGHAVFHCRRFHRVRLVLSSFTGSGQPNRCENASIWKLSERQVAFGQVDRTRGKESSRDFKIEHGVNRIGLPCDAVTQCSPVVA